MTIKSSKEVETCHRVEGHQLVIVLDYIFLTNLPQDISRRVSSNIRQPESSSGDTSHLRVICPDIIAEHIVLVLSDEHLVLKIIRSVITLLHQHQVWQDHPEWLQALHLCLHLLYVHLSLLLVLVIPPLHHLEDQERPSTHSTIQLLRNIEIQGKAERFISTFHPDYISIIKGAKHQHRSSGQKRQQDRPLHLGHQHDHQDIFQHHRRYHQVVHLDLEAERGNDIYNDIYNIMVIIFKLDMTVAEEKGDISPYVHQHPHLFQSPISAINYDIVNYINSADHIHQCISGRFKDHHIISVHQDMSVIRCRYAHPPQRPHRSSIEPSEIGYECEDEFGDSPHISSRSSDASTEMLQEELPPSMTSQPPQHLCGHLHLHQPEEQAPHILQPVVDITNIRIVKQTINQRDHRYPAGDNIPHLLRHLHHRAQHLSTHQRFFVFISRRRNQPFDLDIIVIKEEEVDIMRKNDREVIIIQVIKTNVQEHPGNSSHILSDYHHSINFKRCIIASEFVMDKNNCVMFIYLQSCFTKELIIQLKIILEKITQVDFDITLIIENCRKKKQHNISNIVDFININEKEHFHHLEEEHHIYLEENIIKHMLNISDYSEKPSSPFMNDLIKEIIIDLAVAQTPLQRRSSSGHLLSDIVFDIFNILGHFAQRGHQSSTIIKSDSIIEYHLLDFSSISGPNFFSVPSVINTDIMVIMEKFIRVTHLWCTYHNVILDMNDIIRPEPSAEYHLLDYTSISRFDHPASICIKAELINEDIFAEYHLLDYICIIGPNHISVNRVINFDININAERFIRTICPSDIRLFINDHRVETRPSHPNDDISHIDYDFNISYISIAIFEKKKFIYVIFMSYINLSYDNLDLVVGAERFIGDHHYTHSMKNINREVLSEVHNTYGKFIRTDSIILESIDESTPYVHQHPHLHHGASSMNTSGKRIISVQDYIVNQEIFILTIPYIFLSKYFIHSESIIDNYSHIILVTLHPWEALDITHSCQSDRAGRPHRIEWNKINHLIIPKNIDYKNIIHQKSDSLEHHYISAEKGRTVNHDIVADLSSRTIIKDLSIIDTIIYDTIIHHIDIYDSFGIIIEDDIDLTSVKKEYILIMLIDFMKQTSGDIDLISSEDITVLDNVTIEKEDIISWINIVIKPNIQPFIIKHNLNNHQSFINNCQRNSLILNYLILTNIYDTYHLLISCLNYSNNNLIMVGIMDHHFDQNIVSPAISIQLYEQSPLNIAHLTDIASDIYYRLEFHIEHIIIYLESYITYHLKAYFTSGITLDITYVNQLIKELYSIITETEIITNVNPAKTSYMDIMIAGSYITVSDIMKNGVIISVEGRIDI